MAWKKGKGSGSGSVTLGNWLASINSDLGVLEITHDTLPGIVYKNVSDFSLGNFDYTVFESGFLKVQRFQGWLDTISRPVTDELPIATVFNDIDTIDVFINYIFNTTSTEIPYEFGGTWESPPLELTQVYRHLSSFISVEGLGETFSIESALLSNSHWGDYNQQSNNTAVAVMPLSGVDLRLRFLKFKLTLSGEVTVSKMETTVTSKKQIRIFDTGYYEQTPYMEESFVTVATETF